MRSKILPSAMATSQKELNSIFSKLKGKTKHLHFDVGDGKFVPTKINWFNFRLSNSFSYSAHIMLTNPLNWIKKKGSRFDLIIFHSTKENQKVIDLIKSKNKKVGIALKPKDLVSSIKKYLPLLDYVLILTVHPGYYGAKYLKTPLKKISQIRRSNPNIKIIIDGGMDPTTIQDAKNADYFVSGSFISKSKNPRKAIRELRESIS